MRIAQLLYSGLGGHGSVAFSLINADKDHEWTPIMGFLGIEPLSEDYEKNCKEKGIDYTYFPAVSGNPWKMWPMIYQWLDEKRPEAVILHSPTAILPCLWYSRGSKVPLVIVEHESNVLKRSVDWLFSSFVQVFADSVVLLTSDYKLEMQQTLGFIFQNRKNYIIPNGIDTMLFCPHYHRLNEDNDKNVVRLGMAARFIESKRQDILVEMMLELIMNKPDVKWELSLPGSGVNFSKILHAVKKNRLEKNIAMPGQLRENSLAEWYKTLDMYIHASEAETMSTALMQAMSTGLPIIASNIPGVKNMIGNSEEYGLCVSNDQKSFAREVDKLNSDFDKRYKMGINARKKALDLYSNLNMFKSYNKLVSKNAKKRSK